MSAENRLADLAIRSLRDEPERWSDVHEPAPFLVGGWIRRVERDDGLRLRVMYSTIGLGWTYVTVTYAPSSASVDLTWWRKGRALKALRRRDRFAQNQKIDKALGMLTWNTASGQPE